MKRVLIGLIIILSSILLADESFAQWKKIADFIDTNGINYSGEYISCVYFLDLPGTPSIGYVSTYNALYKTIDGGSNWTGIFWPDTFYGYITDICFKDSLTGWVTIFNEFGNSDAACFTTIDGGTNWTELPVPGVIFGANAVFFDTLTKNLLLSSIDSGLMISTDLGNTWTTYDLSSRFHTTAPYFTTNFSFSSDSNGLVQAGFDASYGVPAEGFLITSDGGKTWSFSEDTVYCKQPLTIPGTPICFEADIGRIIIRRSDDYGQTWRQLADFGPVQDSLFNDIAPYGMGLIRGNLSRLYIQTDSGMYVSLDSGVTWTNDGGPPYNSFSQDDLFYSANGITIAGMTYDSNGGLFDGGLWEENWPQAGVKESGEESSCLSIAGPYPNPSEMSGDNVSILAHYCLTGSVINAQVYNVIGSPVGSAVTFTSDGQTWDRIDIPAPPSAGAYYIQVSVGAFSSTLGYSVY